MQTWLPEIIDVKRKKGYEYMPARQAMLRFEEHKSDDNELEGEGEWAYPEIIDARNKSRSSIV